MAFQRSLKSRTFMAVAALAVTAVALTTSGCAMNPFKRGPSAMSSSGGSDTAIGVNAFLWRASLDTIAFMPLASADPFGGVIITDWYAPPETPNERFKVNVYILGRKLRADGLKVSVFRQQQDASGRWNDVNVGPEVAVEFENAVLSQARELRLRAVAQPN